MTDPAPPRPSDHESSFQLLLRARAGEAEAQECLCARYLPRLHRWAHGRLPRSARTALDTGDIVQDVLIRALNNLPAFEPEHEGSFPAYLRKSLMNRMADEAKRISNRQIRDALDSSHPSSDASPLEEAIGAEAIARYEAALERLRPVERDAVIARCEWGLSHQELGELLGKSPGATQVMVHRALKRLAEEMANDQRA